MQCDVFFWITGFTSSFFLLKRLQQNEGKWWCHPSKVFFERVLRLWPLYMFILLFLWKFIGLFGGAGPRFYQFEDQHSCNQTWFWHMLNMNNVYPWVAQDNCLTDSWYVANDVWFMAIGLNFIDKYLKNKKLFMI